MADPENDIFFCVALYTEFYEHTNGHKGWVKSLTFQMSNPFRPSFALRGHDTELRPLQTVPTKKRNKWMQKVKRESAETDWCTREISIDIIGPTPFASSI